MEKEEGWENCSGSSWKTKGLYFHFHILTFLKVKALLLFIFPLSFYKLFNSCTPELELGENPWKASFRFALLLWWCSCLLLFIIVWQYRCSALLLCSWWGQWEFPETKLLVTWWVSKWATNSVHLSLLLACVWIMLFIFFYIRLDGALKHLLCSSLSLFTSYLQKRGSYFLSFVYLLRKKSIKKESFYWNGCNSLVLVHIM